MKPKAIASQEELRLLHLVTEHAMRICDDELLVSSIRQSAPKSEAAFAALGKLLTRYPTTLHAGSPLHSFVSGTALDETWRGKLQPNQQSLWATLEFYVALYAEEATELDPLENYIRLRDRSLQDSFDK